MPDFIQNHITPIMQTWLFVLAVIHTALIYNGALGAAKSIKRLRTALKEATNGLIEMEINSTKIIIKTFLMFVFFIVPLLYAVRHIG